MTTDFLTFKLSIAVLGLVLCVLSPVLWAWGVWKGMFRRQWERGFYLLIFAALASWFSEIIVNHLPK